LREITVDSSIIMDNVACVEELMKEHKIIVPYTVLDELDGLKDGRDYRRAYKARRAIRFIESKYDQIEFIGEDFKDKLTVKDNDNIIIQVARLRGTALLTKDIGMKVRAKRLGIEVINPEEDDEYKGFTRKFISATNNEDNEFLANIYSNPEENVLGLKTNEYLIIKNLDNPIVCSKTDTIVDYETVDILRWDGNSHVKLAYLRSRKGIKPKNDLQRCAVDLLLNKDIPVKGIFGAAGCGKTYLATQLGLVHLKELETYKRLMMVRNPIGPGEQIGFLKGDKDDKIGDFFKPIIQHLDNGEVEANDLISKGKLVKEIPNFMKGLDIQDTYILVDEAEDLDTDIIKLLGTRVSKGSCIVFTGDYSQSEGKFRNDNGILELIKRASGSEIFGCIVLEEDLRSEASKLFAEIF